MIDVSIHKVCPHCPMRFYFGTIGNEVVSEEKQFEEIDAVIQKHIQDKHTGEVK